MIRLLRHVFRSFLSTLLAPVLLAPALASPAVAAVTVTSHRTPASCASTLDCTAAELDAMPLQDRLEFVRLAEEKISAEFIPGFRHWHNIQGIIRSFIDDGLGAPGSWISLVDSGILEGLERGSAIALGLSDDDYGNPGSQLWADYLRRLQRGELTKRWVHDRAWGDAEQASTEHGLRIAEQRGVRPNRIDWNIYQYSEMYRWTLRNQQPALFIVNKQLKDTAGVPLVPADFLRWFTDVTISEPAYWGGQLAHDLAQPDPVGIPVSSTELMLAYLPELESRYQTSHHQPERIAQQGN